MKRIRVITTEGKEHTFDSHHFDNSPPLLQHQGVIYALEPAPTADPSAVPGVRTYRPAPILNLDGPEPGRQQEPGGTDASLSSDGPTLLEWVEAGYAVEAYPPYGYAAKPFTADEKAQALALQEDRKAARKANKADLEQTRGAIQGQLEQNADEERASDVEGQEGEAEAGAEEGAAAEGSAQESDPKE